MHTPLRHWVPRVHGWPWLSRHAVPPALQVVFTVSAQPVVVPAVQVVAQAVVVLQSSPFAPPDAVGVEHVAVLSHKVAGVNMLLAHEAAAHAVDDVQQSTLQTCGEAHWSLAVQAVPTGSWLTHALLPLQ